MRMLSLTLLVCAFMAHAEPPSALEEPAPRAAAAEVKPFGFGEHFAKTTGIGVASSAAGVLIGAGLGSLSNQLLAAALPVLLANLFLPPFVTTLVAQLLGNWDHAGRFDFWLPVAGAFVVNAAAYVIASLFFAVPWTNPVALLLYALADGVLMSGATVGIMHWRENKTVTTVHSFSPGVSDTVLVPLVKVAL